MLWKGRRETENVEDQRDGSAPSGGIGRGGFRLPGAGSGMRSASGGGISGIVILVVLFFVLKACGIDPMQVLSGPDSGGALTQNDAPSPPLSPAREDEMTSFVKVIMAETEDTWTGIFQTMGVKYPQPTLVLFDGQTRSACGAASAASGPFYCPGDQKVYIDLAFYDELAQRFGASGDFAQAYVLAHEVGHHVQNITGVLPKFNQMRESMGQSEANAMSVRVELQADCFAGIWAHTTAQKGLLEKGDLEEALNAAQQIGDDTLQRRTQGFVVPDSFNHGTSAQRVEWFSRGAKSGKLEDCDTFNAQL
jgi:uncharacterized protein